jgi:hypothetical protein
MSKKVSERDGAGVRQPPARLKNLSEGQRKKSIIKFCSSLEIYLSLTKQLFNNMTEVTGISKHIIPQFVGNDLVLIDRHLMVNLIAEIEDRLDELETITDPEFMKKVSLRVSDIESGKVDGLDEKEIFELLK